MLRGWPPMPPDTCTPSGRVPPTPSTSPATGSSRLTRIVPAPKMPACRPAVPARSTSVRRADESRRTAGTDWPLPVSSFSTASGFDTVAASTGASLRASTVVESCTASDQVPVGVKAPRRSMPACSACAASATCTVSTPGRLLKSATGRKRSAASAGSTSAAACEGAPSASPMSTQSPSSRYCHRPCVARSAALPTTARPPTAPAACPPPGIARWSSRASAKPQAMEEIAWPGGSAASSAVAVSVASCAVGRSLTGRTSVTRSTALALSA